MRYSYVIFLLCVCIIITSTSCEGHDIGARKLYKSLRQVELSDHTLFGHQDDILYGYSFKTPRGSKDFSQSDIKNICDDYPAVLGLELGRTEVGNINLDDQYVDNIVNAAITHHERGGIVTISWHADNPVTKSDAWDLSDPNTVGLILRNPNIQNEFVKRLSRIADILCQIKDKKGHLIPIVFRPYHEMNHGFWWGNKNTSSEDFVLLWRLTYNYLVKVRKLKNLLWAYSPYSADTIDGYSTFYPGDKFVDVICFERYQGVNQRELYIKKMQSGIRCATDFARAHKKVVAVSETGLKSVTEKDWWTNSLLEAIKDSHIAYVLVWRNAGKSKEFYAPYKGHISEENFKEFYDDKRILLLNDYNTIINLSFASRY